MQIICVIYVDDTIFFRKTNKAIDRENSSLKAQDFDLTDEGDINAFLGIQNARDMKEGSITMTQPFLLNTTQV